MYLIAGFVLFFVFLTLVSGYAFKCGGRDERAAMASCLLAVILTEIVGAFSSRWHAVDWSLVAVDGALFVALVAIAHRSYRFWPLWAASFQLVGLATHLSFLVQVAIIRDHYATLQPLWAFPVLAAILVGTYRRIPSRDG